jgi:hypothetical protein
MIHNHSCYVEADVSIYGIEPLKHDSFHRITGHVDLTADRMHALLLDDLSVKGALHPQLRQLHQDYSSSLGYL